MKKFTAKIVSFIVVVCVLTMLFPATVFAAGDAGVTKTAYSEYYPVSYTHLPYAFSFHHKTQRFFHFG